jgi:regulatory protein YycI of two-component signal transduction system YycFG
MDWTATNTLLLLLTLIAPIALFWALLVWRDRRRR